MSAVQFCDQVVSTKRRVRESATDFGEMEEYLTGIRMTVLYPVGDSFDYLTGVDSAAEVKEAYFAGGAGEELPDIKEGDHIIYGTEPNIEYPVFFVAEWPHPEIPTLHIIVKISTGDG